MLYIYNILYLKLSANTRISGRLRVRNGPHVPSRLQPPFFNPGSKHITMMTGLVAALAVLLLIIVVFLYFPILNEPGCTQRCRGAGSAQGICRVVAEDPVALNATEHELNARMIRGDDCLLNPYPWLTAGSHPVCFCRNVTDAAR